MIGDPSILPAHRHFKYETLCRGELIQTRGCIPFSSEEFKI